MQGKVNVAVDNNILFYAASAPADHRVSFAGSGLVFGDVRQAFSKTPNAGSVKVNRTGQFTIHLKSLPNAYYDKAASVLVPPVVYLLFFSGGVEKRGYLRISLHGYPYRLINHPAERTDATFYNVPLTVRSQEDILWDSSYPCRYNMPENFWANGKKPPL